MYVGCCGYCMGRGRYYTTFRTVELQETFYDLPDLERLGKLRAEASEGFVFNMKAYQGVTHDLDSPTWRRARRRLDESLRGRVGLLRPTKENLELWEEVARRARALGARVVVVQTPPSFGYTEENYRNVVDFFSATITRDFIVGWEPRGTWLVNPDRIRGVVEKFDNLIHVVDPFKARPVVGKYVTYFRLHGIGRGEVNYSYRYTDDDLGVLCGVVREVSEVSWEVYVMFNNVYMALDAQRFMSVCKEV